MSEQNTLNLIHHLLLDFHGFFDGSIFGRSYLPRSNKHFPLSHRVRKFQVSCTTFFSSLFELEIREDIEFLQSKFT